jgi:hypothetical protein
VQEDVVKVLVKKVEGFGALLDAEEVLAEVVLFTIVSKLLIHEDDEGSRSGKDPVAIQLL